jgi:WD40 repeat protein
VILQSTLAQDLNNSAYDIVQQDRFGIQFQNGDTNTPLLAMDWFSGPHIDYFCYVSRAGKADSARNVINWAIQGGNHVQLDQTNLDLLIATMNALPSPPKVQPPQERWLVIRGIRTNQWFKYVYDRQNVPSEVEKLFDLTGGYLEWFIPIIGDHPIASNANVNVFIPAKKAPIAISFGGNGIQTWDLRKEQIQDTVPLNIIPYRQSFGPYQDVQAVSTDGKIIVVACENGICAVDLTTKTVLWNKDGEALEHNGRYNKHLVIGGDKGQFLFAAGAHTLERWDLITGKMLAVLATNQPTIKSLEVSQDGKIVLAGFDNSTFDESGKSFSIWKANEDNPVAHIEKPQLTASCISPDGRIVALDVFGNRTLELWNWAKNSTETIPLRLPYGGFCAIQMYWSPDGTTLATLIQEATYSIVIYDTTSWKPLARRMVGPIVHIENQSFHYDTSGKLFQIDNGNPAYVDENAILTNASVSMQQ